MTLYLIRHATPDRTLAIPYHTPPGPPLAAQGEDEAQCLGEFLSDKRIECIYTSPLARATQTARIIGGALGVQVRADDAIAEWMPSEDETNVQARLLPFMQKLKGECIAIVTHGWIVRTVLQNAGMSDAELLPYCNNADSGNPLPCAGVWCVNGTGKPQLVFTP